MALREVYPDIFPQQKPSAAKAVNEEVYEAELQPESVTEEADDDPFARNNDIKLFSSDIFYLSNCK